MPDICYGELTVRTRRGTAVGVVAKRVYVEATFCVGSITDDVVGDLSRRRLRVLLEDNSPVYAGLST